MTDPRHFREDVEHVPNSLLALSEAIDAGKLYWPLTGVPRRLLLLGMGSSHFAADVCARRLRAAGMGSSFPGARHAVRYDGDDDVRVALLTEPLVAELLAAEWWQAEASTQ
jgi:glutamine---fructose-6-phosphate transaminase (isomerizing)